MEARPLTMSAAYLAVLRAYHELHRLKAAGQEGSPEADAVRDAADAPWYALTEIEKERIGGLSEDLCSITDPPKPAPRELNPQVQSRLNDAYLARQRGEWDRALELLRRSSDDIEPSFLSYLRGTIWLGAGAPRTATIFLEHALALQPDNSDYLTLLLNALLQVDPAEAARRAERVLEAPGLYKPMAVVQAANIVNDSTADVVVHGPGGTEASRRSELATDKDK